MVGVGARAAEQAWAVLERRTMHLVHRKGRPEMARAKVALQYGLRQGTLL